MAFEPLPADRWPDAPARYPDPSFVVEDPRFASVVLHNAAVERVATGFAWVEGPVWFGDQHSLLFSDIPASRMHRCDALTGATTVFRADSGHANGNTRDRQGRLVTCEHLGRRVTRTEHDGSITVLADAFEGRPLNAPNDVVVGPDGAVWFTDPGYGILTDYEGRRATAELPPAVYRVAAGEDGAEPGRLERVVDDVAGPNGLCFSPDGTRLHLVDSTGPPRSIRVYDLEDGRPVRGRLFADTAPGSSDGIRCDADGNVWAAATVGGDGYDGVHVYAPDGTRIGRIRLPEACANLCFGGPHGNRLFMAASRSIYAVHVHARGA